MTKAVALFRMYWNFVLLNMIKTGENARKK